MDLFNFFRRKKERENTNQERKESDQQLKNTPPGEMFNALREEAGIVSIQELWETYQLTPEILSIWEQTLEEMFLLSLNPEKVRLLTDTKHLYFITHKQYKQWDRRLKFFMDTLAGQNSINSFSSVNDLGCIIFLNPLGEPIDYSHDEVIGKMFENFYKKAQSFPPTLFLS